MNEPKNFLQRWSRRKLEPSDTSEPSSAEKISPDTNEAARPPTAEFDPATLPSLDSITAGSNIRAFLQTGVPQALAQAALRRAWSADLAIRDFIGLSENSWDFNKPGSIPGFGPIEPENIQRAAEQLLGESKVSPSKAKSPAQPPMQEPDGNVPTDAKIDEAQRQGSGHSGNVTTASVDQTEANGAPQHEDHDAGTEPGHAPLRQRHGGALPE